MCFPQREIIKVLMTEEKYRILAIGKVKVVVKKIVLEDRAKKKCLQVYIKNCKVGGSNFFLQNCSIYVTILLLSYGAKLD